MARAALDRQLQQIALPALRRLGQRVQRGIGLVLVPLGAQPFQLFDLPGAHGGIVDHQHIDGPVGLRLVFVHADDGLRAAVDARLGAGGGFLDAHFRQAGLDRLRHAAELLDLLNMRPGLLRQIMRQPLDEIAAAPRIDDAGRAALLRDEELSVARDAGGEIRRQRQRFVQRIGVQRLGSAMGRRQRLDAGAHDIVVCVLRGEAPARGLAMRAQRQRTRVLGAQIPA